MAADKDWRRKLDHRLRAALGRADANAQQTSRSVSAFVRFKGEVSELEALGCTVGNIAGDVAVVTLTLADVQSLAEADAVVSVQLATPTRLD
jgi:hypothetical protein